MKRGILLWSCLAITFGVAVAPVVGHQHEGDVIIGRSGSGRLLFEANLNEIRPLEAVNGLLKGWAGDEPGFEALMEDEPDEGFYRLAAGARIWLGLADEVRSVRPYPRLADLWRMVARSAFTQLRYSALLLGFTLAGLVLVYLGPPIALVVGVVRADRSLAAAGASGWAVMTATYLPMTRYHRLHPLRALTLPAAAALYAAMTADSARRHWAGAGVEWKGRRYLR